MKHWGLIFLILALGCILAAVAVKCWPRTLPPEQCSEVYRRYCDRDDLKVAFVKDYRIDDTTVVDVTTITAKDSASWKWLMIATNSEPLIDSLHQESIRKEQVTLSIYKCPKDHPEIHFYNDSAEYNIVICSPMEKTLYIFNVNDDKDAGTLYLVYYNLLLNNSKNEQQN